MLVELRKNELKTLLTLEKLDGKASVDQVTKTGGLAHAAVMRAVLELTDQNLVRLHEEKQTIVSLNSEGRTHAKNGLPERRLIASLIERGGKAKIDEAVEDANLGAHLVPIALGWLLRKGWVTYEPKKGMLKAQKIPRQSEDERVLERLAKRSMVYTSELNKGEREAVATLRKRKLLVVDEKTFRTLELTGKGRRLIRKGTEITEEVSQLTPKLLLSRKWRKTKFRKFDVTAPGPVSYPGKLHPLQQMIERARMIFLEMGFAEIRGPLVETAFWNFDALFQPQYHPAREMMDTFYLSVPKTGKLPCKEVVDAVAKTHENGWITGSSGWGYKWSPKEAKRLVLRTHTTSETIKYLSKHKKPPIKVFSVDRVYRNEQITSTHTAEFHQIEGIVADKTATLRELMGTLKTFYSRFGLRKVQFWPCYFPYTEPSAQAMVYVPKLKRWIELCGMGMFRPEVLVPMGIKYPVLAWGGGLERLAMVELDLDDIRLLYGNRLEWLRGTPLRQ